MHISISDFRNIKELKNLEVKDGKINFLTGVSGTGKTAIASAIKGDYNSLDTRAGADATPIIECNPMPDKCDIFNNNTVDDLFISAQSSTAFDVVMLKTESYKQAECAYYESIKALQEYELQIKEQYAWYSKVIEQTKANFINNGDLHASCSPSKAEKAVLASSPERTELVKERGGNYLTWLYEGTQQNEWASDPKICPFCHEPIPEAYIQFIESVATDNGKEISRVATLAEALSNNGIGCGDIFKPEAIHKALDKLIKINKAKTAYARLLSLLQYAAVEIRHDYSLNDSYYAPSNFFDEIPGLNKTLEQLAESSQILKKAFGILRSEFNKTVSKNTNTINDYLRKFDIPYCFKVISLSDDDSATYILAHSNSTTSKDYKSKLSYGERNIIALLLFLLKPRDKNELVIIDDPVSSYDDYRRILIYRMIFELDLSNTILLMSHDHVFAKYALFYHDKANRKMKSGANMSHFETTCAEKTGCILFLETDNEVLKFSELNLSDYGTLESHITKRLNSPGLTIRQKIINLRILLETISHSDGIEHVTYGYLSALLHYQPNSSDDINNQVVNFFASQEYDEIDVLNWIQTKTGINLPPVASINPRELHNDENLCQFERLIALRETVNDLSLKAELSDMVHLNSALVYCLNPYSYLPCSNKARRLLRINENELPS